MKEFFRQASFREKALYVILALLPVAVIAVLFLLKILEMKHFVFGDDVQLLKWFRGGRIAFPLREIVADRIIDGRFFPLCYENLNILSLLNPRLTLTNLAEHCFYMQAGMWLLCCAAFTVLMTDIAETQKIQMRPGWWMFLPLALLTLLCTPAFVSYFLMLIFAETRLCVLFALFFLFYYRAYRKESTAGYIIVWFLATFTIFCKENVIAFFAAICGVWGLFGWKLLSKKHKFFLTGVLASIAVFLLLYYFIVYHNIVEAYNSSRLVGRLLLVHVGTIFRDYPVWIAGFLLGIRRVIGVVFYREKKHLFMDAMLFAVLGFFLSYLALKLTDWWYWGVGAVVLLPVFFYWFVVSEKAWCRAAIFLVTALCFAVSVKPAYQRMEQTLLAQKEDPAFLEKIDSVPGGRRVLFPMSGNREEYVIEDACYGYLKKFLEKFGTPGKWEKNVIQVNDLPEHLTPEDVCVVWRGVPLSPENQNRLQVNGFQRIASCYYYEAFAFDAAELDAAWKTLPVSERRIPCRAPFFRLGKGFAVPENWGCWTDGKQAKLAVAIPPELRGKDLDLVWDVYTYVHIPKHPKCKFRILMEGRVLYDGESTDFPARFTLSVPAEYTEKIYLPLVIEIENPVSPRSLGESDDPRLLGIGIKNVTMREK